VRRVDEMTESAADVVRSVVEGHEAVLTAVEAVQAEIAGLVEAAVPRTARRGAALGQLAAIAIECPVGAEAVSGSTRLKAGTAQKIVLNAFSTALMVRRGRTVGTLMGGMRVANTKLRGRAVQVCVEAMG
jgi:N-acetylmuramic acid 6-phosphate etherase